MLNYIWAGLIVFSLVFALVRDVNDIRHDTYRNGAALPVTIKLDKPGEIKPEDPPRAAHIVMDQAAYRAFYHNTATPADSYAGTVSKTEKGYEVRIAADATLPAP